MAKITDGRPVRDRKILVSLSEDEMQRVKKVAKEENRSLGNWLYNLVLRELWKKSA